MEKSIQDLISAIMAVRKQYVLLLEEYSTDQINLVPVGFNNNILWNAAHIITVQQMIVYGLADQNPALPKEQTYPFRRGSKPEMAYDVAFINQLKFLLIDTVDILHDDIKKDKFSKYNKWTAPTGFEVHDLGTALTFNLFHESLHLGQMICLKKLL
jgi:DinB superfamily